MLTHAAIQCLQIKKALDPRMEEKKTAKHDPWVTGGGYGYSSRDGSAPSSPPTLRYTRRGLGRIHMQLQFRLMREPKIAVSGVWLRRPVVDVR